MDPAGISAPPQPPVNESLAVTPSMVDSLRATKPWVTFVGVLGLIGATFLLLGAIALVAMKDRMPMTMAQGFGTFGAIIYLAMALLYIAPSLYLLNYGSAIGRVQANGGISAMEDALRNQKSFWKFVGILTLIMTAFMLIVLAIALVGGLASLGAMSR